MYHYASYFILTLLNHATSLCEYKLFVTNLQRILTHNYLIEDAEKTNEVEAYNLINSIIPDNFNIEPIYRYLDSLKNSKAIDSQPFTIYIYIADCTPTIISVIECVLYLMKI